LAPDSDHYRGLRKGYKAIFTLPDARVLYASLVALTLLEAWLVPNARLPLLLEIVAIHTLPLANRRIFIPKRVAGLTLYTLLATQPLLWVGDHVAALYSASLIAAVVAATLVSPVAAIPYAALAALAVPLSRSIVGVAAVMILAATSILLARIDYRIRRAVGVSGLGFLNAFFHYILAGEREGLEGYMEKISRERVLTLHLYRIASGDATLLDIVVSEIHPGPFREIGSSTLPQAFMKRTIPTAFLKAPATHSEDLASSKVVEEIRYMLPDTMSPQRRGHGIVALSSTESAAVNTIAISSPGVPPLVLIEPQVPMEDLPRVLLKEVDGVLVDAHSMIDEEYLEVKPGTKLYFDVALAAASTIFQPGSVGPLKAAAVHIEYSDGAEVAPGGITLALLEAGERILIVNIDGNNMDPAFHAHLRGSLAGYADHIVIATTDTHLYSGAISGVEYKPVGTQNKELASIICDAARRLGKNLRPAGMVYRPLPVKAKYLDGKALEQISVETEKNLRDGAKIFSLMTLTPTLLALLDKLGYLLPVLVDHALQLLYIALR